MLKKYVEIYLPYIYQTYDKIIRLMPIERYKSMRECYKYTVCDCIFVIYVWH
jgi:hypothetical protein